MGWFDEQIRQRIRDDEEILDQAYLELSSVVLGSGVMAAALNDDKKKTENAFEEILKYFRVKPTEVPPSLTDMDERLEYLLRPSGVMRRMVSLKDSWYKDGVGPLIARTAAGDTVALIPGRFSGYSYFDYAQGKSVRVTRRNAANICSDAICFYRPLPPVCTGTADLFRYMASTLSRGDVLLIMLATLACALLGLLTPYATRALFNQIVPSGRAWLLGSIGCLLAGAALGSLGLSIIKNLLVDRVQTKVSVATEAALMARVISLPTAFFKQYSAGELANRAAGVGTLCTMLVQVVFSLGLTSVFSLVYIAQVFTYAPALALPALGLVAVNGLWIAVSVKAQTALNLRKAEADARLEGLVYGLYSGIQKIKLSGAERRAFGKWASAYKESARCTYDPPLLIKLAPAVSPVLMMAGTALLYYCSLRAGVSAADYLAFSGAYGQVSAALTLLGPAALMLGSALPILRLLAPVLAQTPEISTGKRMVTKISGGVELSHVSFRYSEDMPLILDDLSLKIRPGQYVAVVGSTGCGKSTLLRLLLGFETPQKGAVYYDGKDIQSMDLKSLRQRIGVVLQNSTLFSGSIFQNIAVAAPRLTMEDAWAAAEAAGIAEDIRAMPMGMNTIISEGGGGISGGQKQRLMIARAIASRPKLLMFDEATSALDNLTQKLVSQSLDNLHSTRIVIAHRLSTIRQCDRIIVLDKGHIVEDGNYEQLLANNGFFAELVERQQLGSTGFVEKTTIF